MRKVVLIIICLSIVVFFPGLSLAKLSIGKIQLQGNIFFKSDRLGNIIKSRPGQPLNNNLLQEDIDNMIRLYEDNGFPYCRIVPEDFTTNDKDEVSFKLNIDEGPRVKIQAIYFDGLKYTKFKTLLREIRIIKGDYFSQEKLDVSVARLDKLPYIRQVRNTKLESDIEADLAFLTFDISENKPNSFSGILGYVPSTKHKDGYFAGNVSLTLDNILGSGRRTKVNWSKKDPYSSELQFEYREPYFINLPLSLTMKVKQFDYDSTYSQFAMDLGVEFNMVNKIDWGIVLGWERIAPDVAGKNYLANSRRYTAGINAGLDLRDSFRNPRKGIYYNTEVIYSRKSNYATDKFAPIKATAYQTRYTLDLENFVPTFPYQCWAWAVHLKTIRSDEEAVPFVDQFKMGGLNSLRGYKEDQFAGSSIVWSNLEYRYLISYDSRIFGFVDYGYFYRLSQDLPTEIRRKVSGDGWSYGVGLSVGSRVGVFGIDYAIGEEDKITNGKVHFGITNRF